MHAYKRFTTENQLRGLKLFMQKLIRISRPLIFRSLCLKPLLVYRMFTTSLLQQNVMAQKQE